MSDDNDHGSIFTLWNLLMIALFGFITKRVYDYFTREEQPVKLVTGALGTETEKGAEGTESSTGAGKSAAETEKDGSRVEDVGTAAATATATATGVAAGLAAGSATDQSDPLLKSKPGADKTEGKDATSASKDTAGGKFTLSGKDTSLSEKDAPAGKDTSTGKDTAGKDKVSGKDKSGDTQAADVSKQVKDDVAKAGEVKLEHAETIKAAPSTSLPSLDDSHDKDKASQGKGKDSLSAKFEQLQKEGAAPKTSKSAGESQQHVEEIAKDLKDGVGDAAVTEASKLKGTVKVDTELLKSAPAGAIKVETEKLKSAPADALKVETEKLNSPSDAVKTEIEKLKSAPVDAIKGETEQLKSAPADAIKVETEKSKYAADTGKVETEKLKSAPADAVKVETEKLKSASADAIKVETAQLKSAPGDAAKVETEQLKSAPGDAAKVETEQLKSAPGDAAKVETEQLKSATQQGTPAKAEEVKEEIKGSLHSGQKEEKWKKPDSAKVTTDTSPGTKASKPGDEGAQKVKDIAQDLKGRTSDMGSGTSDAGKGTPDTGKGTSDLEKETSEAGKVTSDAEKGISGVEKGISDAGKAIPDTGKGTSDIGKETSEIGKGTSDAGKVTSDVEKVTFDAGIGRVTSDAGKETSDAEKVTSDAGKVTSDAGKVTSDAGKVTPDAGKGTFDTGKGTSDAGKVTSDAGIVTADLGKVTSVVGTVTPDVGKGTSDTGKFEATSQQATVGDSKQGNASATGLGSKVLGKVEDITQELKDKTELSSKDGGKAKAQDVSDLSTTDPKKGKVDSSQGSDPASSQDDVVLQKVKELGGDLKVRTSIDEPSNNDNTGASKGNDDKKFGDGDAKKSNEDNGFVLVSPPRSPTSEIPDYVTKGVNVPLTAAMVTTEHSPSPASPTEEQKQEMEEKQKQVENVMAVVSKEKHSSVFELIDDLTTKQQKTTDFDKARALFIWLSSKHLKTLSFDTSTEGSDESKLTDLKEGKTTYAQVYQTLCRNAGLECELIHGYAKGVGYKPGMKFKGEGFRHSWNAVKVNGEWQLVDPNWGARHVVGKKEDDQSEASDENTIYQLDEYYFLPNPREMIHSHLPDDSKWQLLDQPITKEQFENLVLCKSPFFKFNLQIVTNPEAVIQVKKEAEVKLRCPSHKKDKLVFMFTLTYPDGGDSYQGVPLSSYGMQRMKDNISSVVVRPPAVGEYRLVIHIKDFDQAQKVPGKFYYSEVCEYGLNVTEAYPTLRPFPPVAHTSWGAGDSFYRYQDDLVLMKKDVVVPTDKGVAEVKIALKKKLRFLAKLKHVTIDQKSLEGHVIYRIVDDVAVFNVRPPVDGEYGLELYANDKSRDGSTMHHIYEYLIVASGVKSPVEPWPQLPSTFLGPQASFAESGMQVGKFKDPFISVNKDSLELDFRRTQPMTLMSQLFHVSAQQQSEELSTYILQNITNDIITFQIRLPKSGFYKFSLFGMPANAQGGNIPCIYNCLLECSTGNAMAKPFPKQLAQWKAGGFLYQPQDSKLESSSAVKFKLRIDGAREVAVVIGEDWTQLQQKGDNIWEGEVDTAKHGGNQNKCVVCANMDEDKKTYATLLEYAL